MDIKTFNSQIEKIIETLSVNELKSLHTEFIARDCYRFATIFNDQHLEFSRLKEAVKTGILRMNIDDLKTIAPAPIKKAVESFMKQDEDAPFVPAPEPKESTHEDPYREPPAGKQEDTISNELPGVDASIQDTTRQPDKRKKEPERTDGVINIKPGAVVMCDTARRAFWSVTSRERYALLNQAQRQQLPFVHKGIDVRGNAINLLPLGVTETLTANDVTAYFLADVWRMHRKADRELKVLREQVDMVVRTNIERLAHMRMLEEVLILQALEGLI